jgi:hypothetical protein
LVAKTHWLRNELLLRGGDTVCFERRERTFVVKNALKHLGNLVGTSSLYLQSILLILVGLIK